MRKYILFILFTLLLIPSFALSQPHGSPFGAVPPDDTAYDAVVWDGSMRAPTQNSVRDWIEGAGGGGIGGVNTQVQYNDGGAFGGDAGFTYNDATDTLTIAGNVGIGTDAPGAKLHIKDSTATAIRLQRDNVDGEIIEIRSTFGGGANNAMLDVYNVSQDFSALRVWEDGTTILGVVGNVGINTASPAGKLHTVLAAGKPAIFGGATIATLTGVTISNANPSVLTKDATIDDGLAVGDVVVVNSGTNATVGTYLVASIVADTSVTLDRQAATGACTNGNITYVDDPIVIESGSGGSGNGSIPRLRLPLQNDAVTPTLAFGDGDSGFYESADDNIWASLNGVGYFYFSEGRFRGNATYSGCMRYFAASSITPVWTFDSDENTGIGRAGADALSLIAGGVEAMRSTETLREIEANATVFQTDGGDVQVKTTALHGVSVGSVVTFADGTGTVSTDVTAGTYYYVTQVDSTTLFNISSTRGGVNITFGDAGTAFTSNELGVVNTLGYGTAQLLLPLSNDATTPTLAFGDGDSGFYESADDAITISLGTTQVWKFTGDSFQGALSGAPAMQREDATSTNPVVLPDRDDIDTGIGHAAADQLSLIAGGVEGIRISEDTTIQVNSFGPVIKKYTITTDNTDGVGTHTIAEILGGLIRRGTGDEITGNVIDVTDTAANIVAGITGCAVGSGFEFSLSNEDSTHTIQLDGGAGITIAPNDPSTAIPANSTGRFLLIVTNATAASEAATIHALGFTTH